MEPCLTRIALLLTAISLCSHSLADSATQVRPPLVVGFTEFPPAIYSDAQGVAHGPLAEATRELLRKAGYQASFRSLPTARLYAALKNGSITLWAGAGGKPGLAAHTLETRHPLAEIRLQIYHRPETPVPRLPEGLAGQGVIMVGGYDYWERINRVLENPQYSIRLHHTASHLSGLRMLEQRRADFLLGYRIPTEHARRQLGIEPLPSITLERVPIRFIVSRYAPDAEALRDALDRAHEQLMVATPGWPKGDTEARLPAASR